MWRKCLHEPCVHGAANRDSKKNVSKMRMISFVDTQALQINSKLLPSPTRRTQTQKGLRSQYLERISRFGNNSDDDWSNNHDGDSSKGHDASSSPRVGQPSSHWKERHNTDSQGNGIHGKGIWDWIFDHLGLSRRIIRNNC